MESTTYTTQIMKQGQFSHYEWIIPLAEAEGYIPFSDETRGFTQKISVNTPGFKTLPKRALPINPYLKRYVRRSGSITTISREPGGYYTLSKGSVLKGVPRTTDVWPVPDDVRNKALSRLMERAQGSKINSGEMLATYKDTANLIANSAKRISQVYMALRRGHLEHALKSLSLSTRQTPRNFGDRYNRNYAKGPDHAAASAWLELTYGWKPLLDDIHTSAEILASLVLGSSTVTKISASASSSIVGEIPLAPLGYPSLMMESYNARYEISYGIDSESAQLLSRTGITNPLSVAWELVPYSFVVDWFYPVGQYIESFTAFDGLAFKSGRFTGKTRSRATLNPPNQQVGKRTVQGSGSEDFEGYLFQREKLNSFPSLSMPSLKNPFSASHVTSALALLRSAFGR